MFTLFEEIAALDTEKISEEFANIDIASTEEILSIINAQDALVPIAVQQEIPHIAIAVDNIVERFRQGGRLIYVGAGTSGRLGVLDAAECPPTFGTPPHLVQGVIAGGREAAFRAIEGAEDSENDGMQKMVDLGISHNDAVCGIAASGRTPFVIGAMRQANKLKAFTIFISTNSRSKMLKKVAEKNINIDVLICPQVGAEVVAGSTRMKSGTAQKLILNMLTTTSMIKSGKTYNNIMVDLQPTNNKLKERAKRILMVIAEVDLFTAEQILNETNWQVKPALLMLLCNMTFEQAQTMLRNNNGSIKQAISFMKKN